MEGVHRFVDGLSERQWLSLKAALVEFADRGAFSADEALFHVFNTGLGQSAAEVSTVIDDLVDLGYLRALAQGPRRWELIRGGG